MKRVLIFGSNGMAGHMLTKVLSANPDAGVTDARRDHPDPERRFDAIDTASVEALVHRVRPDVVVNCVGLLVGECNDDPVLAVKVNSLFPRHLQRLSYQYGFWLVQLSTDCVFSGRSGPYVESDPADGTDVYAKTKWLGEIVDDRNLTVRTSIVGPETGAHREGLLDWFLSQNGTVRGFARAFWAGVTTLELARAVAHWVTGPHPTGLIHLTNSEPISKYALLVLFKQYFNALHVSIESDPIPHSNTALVSTRNDVGWVVPEYATMLGHLAAHMTSAGPATP